MGRLSLAALLLVILLISNTSAQAAPSKYKHKITKTEAVKSPPAKKPWYETINLRGYAQIRYNRFFETNPNLQCEQCDRSWGNGSLFIRRLRLIFYGDISDNIYLYIQPDFASSTSDGANFGQIRDAYFDLALDEKKESRLRVGQSKVPFGFENLQSSQNRLTLDRGDAINSAVANERDLGIFYYWAPSEIRKRFSYLVSSGLKGSGDYGVLGLGVYNGQTSNQQDLNSEMHAVARLTYPFKLDNEQIIEAGIQGYRGEYV
ncbi:MAG: porin, partial [Alphaproteobacteria bacterium]|nr:porin [Alphaproteobacteria bacterium]